MPDSFPGVRYSIAAPIFNEATVLPVLLQRIALLMEQLDGSAEAIFVDDGSSDCGPIVLQSFVTPALMADAGLNTRSNHFLLLPSAAPLARRVERGLSSIPLGAQYIAGAIA